MSLPHVPRRHAFSRPTQFDPSAPHARSGGTTMYDPTTGAKLPGEYNRSIGLPLGSVNKRNDMTPEGAWRGVFSRNPDGSARSPMASAGAPVAGAPTAPRGGIAASLAPTPTTAPADTSASAPPAFAGLRSLQPVVMGGNPADAMRLLRPSALTPSGTPDAAIAKAREGGVGQTAYGPIAASIPGAASGSLAATVNPAANAATTAMNPPAIGVGSSLTAKVDAADRSPQPPSLGTGAPSAASGSVGGSNVFSRVARATIPTIPGQLAVNVLPHVFNYAKQLLGSAPAPSTGSGSGDTPEAAARGAMGLPPAPSNPVAQASGSNPEDVATAAMPFPRPLKRSVALMDKPAQQY